MSELKERVRVIDLEFKNKKTPYSSHFQDVYFSSESGIAESHYVYLEGSGAQAAFYSKNVEITMAEIGFGVGLNFLLTLKHFRQSRSSQTLRYFSFENRPVRKSSLEMLYQMHPELNEESEIFLKEYPILTPGVHLLRLLGGQVELYLCLGDAQELLSEVDFKADYWFWDGFAPSRNPDAFSPSLFQQVAIHSKPGTRGSSFTAAGWVRRALADQGFEVTKRAGFAHKRECITAEYKDQNLSFERAPWFSTSIQKTLRHEMSVAVIGSGLGGSAIARALADRGFQITVFDPNGIAGRASSNPVGLYNAQLSKVPNPMSQFSQLSLASLIRELDRLKVPRKNGILRTDFHNDTSLRRSDYPSDFYSQQERGVFFPLCGMIDPRELCKARLNHPSIQVRRASLSRTSREEHTLRLHFQGEPQPENFDHVVYCLGADAKLTEASTFFDPYHEQNPTRPIRGQIIFTSPLPSSELLPHALVEEGYATPLSNGTHVIGATYQAKNILPNQEELDTEELIQAARKWPEFSELKTEHVLFKKSGFRLSTPDKLPMVGPLCDPNWMRNHYSKAVKGSKSISAPLLQPLPGEWLLTGLGSRGITYSSLSAEVLASWMTGTPIPLENNILEHIHSSRFLVRNLRKSKVE